MTTIIVGAIDRFGNKDDYDFNHNLNVKINFSKAPNLGFH